MYSKRLYGWLFHGLRITLVNNRATSVNTTRSCGNGVFEDALVGLISKHRHAHSAAYLTRSVRWYFSGMPTPPSGVVFLHKSVRNGFNEVVMNYFELLHEPLAVEPILEKVKSPECGAVSLFVGTARNNFNGREVTSLHYEAYTKMAHNEFMDICKEVRSKWKTIVHIAVQHRLGEVLVSENIVTVALSSPHRNESLAAMTFILDKLKERVPIWKKENYKDANGVWKENAECTEARTTCA